MASAFDFDAGEHQGRILVDAAPAGSYVYELGHALPNQWVRLDDGDSSEIGQTADYSTTPFVRARVSIRAPSAGYVSSAAWVLRGLIGGVKYLEIPINRNRSLSDVAIPTLDAQTNGAGAASIEWALVFATDQDYPTVELPSVQIDAIVLDADTADHVLANRSPEPSEIEVPVTSTIAFDILSSGPTVSRPDVYVNGVVVYQSSTAQGGWSVSIVSTPGRSRTYRLTPPAAFDPFTVYTVRAVHTSFDLTWTFRTVDTVGPSIVSAQATDSREVKVTFDETIVGAGTWTLALVSGPSRDGVTMPAVTPTVTSAVASGGDSVLLSLDIDMTPLATYSLTCTGIADLLGNDVVGATKAFTGYQPPVPPTREFDLYSMLLEHDRRRDESKDLLRFVGCLQEVTDLLLSKIDRFASKVLDVDTATETELDRILRDLGNPFGFDLTATEKRKLARLLVGIYRLKGTDPGIINAIRFFLGIEVTITTPWTSGWILGVSTVGVSTVLASGLTYDKYSYYIVSPVYLTEEQRSRVTAIAKYMQRAPCHLRGIVEPSAPPAVPDHWQVGLSRIGVNSLVH